MGPSYAMESLDSSPRHTCSLSMSVRRCLQSFFPSPSQSSSSFAVKARAAYSYAGAGDADELPFVEGDVLSIVDQSADDWWKAEQGGVVFIVPAAYLEVVEG